MDLINRDQIDWCDVDNTTARVCDDQDDTTALTTHIPLRDCVHLSGEEFSTDSI